MKKAIIVGAGPAGLTAAYELLIKSDIKPIVLEQSGDIGGISKTVNYKGNRIDIGGHRFYSKSQTVMDWWTNIMPVEENQGEMPEKSYKRSNKDDQKMMVRNRVSRIYYLRKFFDYPIQLSKKTLSNLGLVKVFKIGISYSKSQLTPKKEINSLEDFFISRFGNELYQTFFKDYTEKVWGVPCSEISAEWGAQRIKELSVWKAILHNFKIKSKKDNSVSQKDVETSLIERFLYPKLGPGQMWETVAKIIEQKGGEIIMNAKVIGLHKNGNQIKSVSYQKSGDPNPHIIEGEYFFSTMPVQELIRSMGKEVPAQIVKISEGLKYRDFITVGLLVNKLELSNSKSQDELIPDNWIYIQEKDVYLGRLQIFNNWSPYMVASDDKVWLGLEYFCNEGDHLWNMDDADFIRMAIDELDKIGIIKKEEVVDSTIIRMPKAYPSYFGSYSEFDQIKKYTMEIDNLFLIGRNGMHKYNNQDHSMLTAIRAVDNIVSDISSKENIWNVNTEQEYHEEK